MWTHKDFKNMFSHFSIFWMKVLKEKHVTYSSPCSFWMKKNKIHFFFHWCRNAFNYDFVKSVHISSFSGPYSPVFSPNAEKWGPEKLRIRTASRSVCYKGLNDALITCFGKIWDFAFFTVMCSINQRKSII